jgi:hypothetical protein
LLPDGRVLIAGGQGFSGILSTAELYDPKTGTLSSAGHLNNSRADHTATLLPDGKVLIAGGASNRVSGGVEFSLSLATSELYDSATGIWSITSNLNIPRESHAAIVLPNGKALIVGGLSSTVTSNSVSDLDSAELGYNFPAVTAPKITMASVAGKKLIVVGENFDSGAVILINGEEQATRNDVVNPGTTLIAKKGGKRVKPGDKLQVRNADGSISDEFTFTG